MSFAAAAIAHLEDDDVNNDDDDNNKAIHFQLLYMRLCIFFSKILQIIIV